MKAPSAIRSKLTRLQAPEERPRVLDLFAGCGGLSLGFQSAGCQIVGAVEIDALAAQSHAANFYKGAPGETIARHATPRDITQIEPEELVAEFGLGQTSTAIDIIVGGPPCQAYARVGRAKLREVAAHPEAFKIDARANLYLRYLHYVERLKPLALMMENVPDILNFGGHNVVEEMVDTLNEMGYRARYSLINSAHHGVPQMRDRVFLIAFHKSLDVAPRFPKATHWCDLPSGYAGTRTVALKLIGDLFGGGAYAAPDLGHKGLPPAVTSEEALADLPQITLHREGKLRRGARRFTELSRYRKLAPHNVSEYARSMRNWPGFENENGVFDHVLRYLPRDTEIFEAMQEGDEYPAAYRVANALFERKAKKLGLKPNTSEWKLLHRSMVPPYDPTKFPNRWWKLRRDAPSRTLMAHIGKDTYSHIHYDSSQGRVISVREAARLQSFPDGFVFAGTMNPAFRQIGNAVPPLMAKAIAGTMVESLSDMLQKATLAAAE